MGDGHGGKIRGRAGWTDGGRGDRNNKKDVVSVGGGGFGARLSSTASWNKQTVARQTVLFLMGEKLAVPWMFPSTFHFLNAVLSVHHLTSHQCLRKENHALFAAVHNYQPFKTDLFATLNDVVNLCTNKRQAIFCCKSSSSFFSFSSFLSPSRVFKIYGVASVSLKDLL